jgi:hypothetical protein
MERVARIELASSAWKAEVLPLNYTRLLLLSIHPAWWRGVDSNHRSVTRQIYSLIPLATREPLQKEALDSALGGISCQMIFGAKYTGTPEITRGAECLGANLRFADSSGALVVFAARTPGVAPQHFTLSGPRKSKPQGAAPRPCGPFGTHCARPAPSHQPVSQGGTGLKRSSRKSMNARTRDGSVRLGK